VTEPSAKITDYLPNEAIETNSEIAYFLRESATYPMGVPSMRVVKPIIKPII